LFNHKLFISSIRYVFARSRCNESAYSEHYASDQSEYRRFDAKVTFLWRFRVAFRWPRAQTRARR